MQRPHGVTARLSAYGTTIFAEMTALAVKHGAVNLAQGFPDFDGPEFLKEAAGAAVRAGHNQYARSHGLPALNRAIAESWKRSSGLDADPDTMVTVTSGCTEALAATFLGLIEPGDEVILLEPFYDSYHAGVSMAGGVVRAVPLRRGADGECRLDPAELRAAVGGRTRAIVINTPHNPTGKVFTRDELQAIAVLCVERDLLAITDEVYERLVYDPAHPHVHLATLPGMAGRTVTLSSLGKTFSVTGWKVGWAIAPPELSRGVRAAHQFLTFATSTPFQHAGAVAMTPGGEGDAYATRLCAELKEAREFLHAALEGLGFGLGVTRGTYFILADHRAVSGRVRPGMTGREFCRWLPEHAGVAAIPASAFYEHKELGEPLVRFAFCKKMETLREGVARLRRAL